MSLQEKMASESWVVFETADGEGAQTLASLGLVPPEEEDAAEVRKRFWNEGQYPLSREAVTHQQMVHQQEGGDAAASSSRPLYSSLAAPVRSRREHSRTAYLFSVPQHMLDPSFRVQPGQCLACGCCKQLLEEGQRVYHLPTRYLPRDNTFSAVGNFCSAPCLLGYDESAFPPAQRHTPTIYLYLWQLHPERAGQLVHTPHPIELAVDLFGQGGQMTLPEYVRMLRSDELWTPGEEEGGGGAGGIGVVRRTETSLVIVPDKLCLTLHYQQPSDYRLQLGPIPLEPSAPAMDVDKPKKKKKGGSKKEI